MPRETFLKPDDDGDGDGDGDGDDDADGDILEAFRLAYVVVIGYVNACRYA